MSQYTTMGASSPDFTYDGYLQMLDLLRGGGYSFSGYDDWRDKERPVILRHDIDTSPARALALANVEHEAGAHSTYFVLVRTGLYNFASEQNVGILRSIEAMGHEVGLHFDETVYPADADMVGAICAEADVLARVLGHEVGAVSMHRPSKACLEAEWEIPGLVNSYGRTYFKSPFKYLSDSRRRWREPALDVIRSGEYTHLHILTHAFWYGEQPRSLGATLQGFIDEAAQERRALLADNFTDLDSALKEGR